MALIQTGSIVSDIRGKIGGHVFQSGRNGLVLKTQSRSIDRHSTWQYIRRQYLSIVNNQWRNLTAEQKNAWTQWAIYQNIKRGVFKRHYMGGQQAHCMINFYLLLLGEDIIGDPIFTPFDLFDPGPWTLGIPAVFELSFNDSPTITNADAWIVCMCSLFSTTPHASKPRNLKFISAVETTTFWRLDASYKQRWGNYPSAGTYVWIDWFYMSKTNYALSSLISADYQVQDLA
jgi:hypothetical protein